MPTKTITRVELSDAVYRTKRGLSRAQSAALVDLVLREITDVIARSETVKLSSFGTFTVQQRGQRIGRNPKTGAEATIHARRVAVFKASATMKKKIQNHKPAASPEPAASIESTWADFVTVAAEPV